jgi:hypothetical protein
MRGPAVALLTALLALGAEVGPATFAGAEVTYDPERRMVVTVSGAMLEERSIDDESAPATSIAPRELEPGAHLKLGPRGGLALSLRTGESGTSAVTIHGLDGSLRGRIDLPREAPAMAVFIGGPGRTIATITELPSETSPPASWRWDLWSDSGAKAGSFSTPPGVKGGFDPAGETLMVLERDRAVVWDRSGKSVGEPVAGRFHKGASSNRGRVLLLGEDADRKALVLVVDGRPHRFVADAVVFGVAVTADGASAWAWFENGVIRSVDLASASLRAPVPRVVATGDLFVSSFVAEDGGTALVGLATRTPGAERYNGGHIARVTADRVVWGVPFPTAEPTAFLPAAIAAGRKVAAWNRERTVLLDPSSPGARR